MYIRSCMLRQTPIKPIQAAASKGGDWCRPGLDESLSKIRASLRLQVRQSPYIMLASRSRSRSLALSLPPSLHPPFMYISTCLSIYMSIHLPTYLSIYLSTYLYINVSIYLSIHLSIYLSVCLPACRPVFLFTYPPTYLSFYLTVPI